METHLNMNFEKRNKNYFKFYVSPKPFLKFGICLLQIKWKNTDGLFLGWLIDWLIVFYAMSAVFESYNGINTVAYASNVLSYLSSIKDAGFIFSLLYFSFINSALFIDSNKPVLYIHSFIRSLDYKLNSPHCNSIGVLSTATRHDSEPEASCPGTPQWRQWSDAPAQAEESYV